MEWTKKEIASFVDLTSLNSFDSTNSIKEFLAKTKEYQSKGFPVAAVCFYPNFSKLAVETLKDSGIKVAVVAGNFPNSQGYLETRLREAEIALEMGVDEVDIVLNLGEFENGNYEAVVEEITAFKKSMPEKGLKVILETGYLKTPEKIKKASELAIQGGADFLKTSTGKEYPGATLDAIGLMADAIIESQRSDTVGLKVSGGVRTYEDALEYFKLIESKLGRDYITPDKVRIGASSLMANLIDG